jgi:alkylation response protein AidB-like acyl-CoA dehydrogenase
MDFNKTDAQGSIAEMIRDFANKHIRPDMMEWDESQKFPVDLFHKLGELGLWGCLFQLNTAALA